MDTTYTLRAADGKEYGPATMVQVIAWVHEGRVAETTELRRNDMQHWAYARDFEELKFLFAGDSGTAASGAPQSIAPPPGVQQDAALRTQMKSGAHWFYWVAAVSLLNSFFAAIGKGLTFVIGLNFTHQLDLYNIHEGGPNPVTLGLEFVATGVLVVFGFLGSKGHTWSFIAGMVLIALDGVLFYSGPVGAAFHVLVLFFIFRGMQASRALRS